MDFSYSINPPALPRTTSLPWFAVLLAKNPLGTWVRSIPWPRVSLPLLLGKYTRLAQFFGQAEKHYTGHIRFGFATDSFRR